MGVFQSKDTLSELKVRFIDRPKPVEESIKQIVINMGLLLCPRNKAAIKRKRIVNGAPMLFRTCTDIVDKIELDAEDFDDVVEMNMQCEFRVHLTRHNFTPDQWLAIWDQTQTLMSNLYNTISPYDTDYYLAMVNVRRSIKFIYKKVEHF
jgi:hypothetical protein